MEYTWVNYVIFQGAIHRTWKILKSQLSLMIPAKWFVECRVHRLLRKMFCRELLWVREQRLKLHHFVFILTHFSIFYTTSPPPDIPALVLMGWMFFTCLLNFILRHNPVFTTKMFDLMIKNERVLQSGLEK